MYNAAMATPRLPIETRRLIVRRFEERDVPDILDYSACEAEDRFRKRNVDWEANEDAVRSYWTPMIERPVDEPTEWLGLLIEVRELGRVVGNTGFSVRKVGEGMQGSIGWTLGKAFEGNGYVTEAATALLDYLFRAVGFHRVYAMSSPQNVRSVRVMERLGMRREAHFIENCFTDGTWSDEVVYAILADEWKARGRAPLSPAA